MCWRTMRLALLFGILNSNCKNNSELAARKVRRELPPNGFTTVATLGKVPHIYHRKASQIKIK